MLREDTPVESCPTEPPCAIAELPERYPNGVVSGRRAPDGTAWCRCCNTTISDRSNAAFCARHRSERNTQLQHARRRQHRPTSVAVPVETLLDLLAQNERLVTVLGRATVAFNNEELSGRSVWVDDLMLAAKDVSHLIEKDLHSLVAPPRSSQRQQRRATPNRP